MKKGTNAVLICILMNQGLRKQVSLKLLDTFQLR